jgi:hypothetical protein
MGAMCTTTNWIFDDEANEQHILQLSHDTKAGQRFAFLDGDQLWYGLHEMTI